MTSSALPEIEQSDPDDRSGGFKLGKWRMLLAVTVGISLFISASMSFTFQRLSPVSLFATGGGMHAFARAVEDSEVKVDLAVEAWENDTVAAAQYRALGVQTLALERHAILMARDQIRAWRTQGLITDALPADQTFVATERVFIDFCDKQKPAPSACNPEPECTNYKAWARNFVMIQSNTTETPQSVSQEPKPPPLPSPRAALSCSQREVQLFQIMTNSASVGPEVFDQARLSLINVHYASITKDNVADARSFAKQYRILIPRVPASIREMIKRNGHADDSWIANSIVVTLSVLGSIWLVYWASLLWIPLFLIYTFLAITCGAMSNLVRHHVLGKKDRDPGVLILNGGAAACFAILLLMIGVGFTSFGTPLPKTPDPALVVVLSLLAGLNAEDVNLAVKRLTSNIFPNGEATTSEGKGQQMKDQEIDTKPA